MFRSEKYHRALGFTEESEHFFDVLQACYTSEWLSNDGGNKIQQLWKRQDELSTIELHTLGYSIDRMLHVDRKWTLSQIEKTKSNDANNSKGALFEIISLAILHAPTQPVEPSKANNAGFDAIQLFGEKKLRISIKNYGISDRQRDFEMLSQFVENKIEHLLKKFDLPALQIIIDSPMGFPTRLDWFALINRLDMMFWEVKNMGRKQIVLNDGPTYTRWIFMVGPLEADDGKYLDNRYKSFTVIIGAVYHRNEYLNVYSKIDKAVSNLSKHSKGETDDTNNSLIIHLPQSMDIRQAEKWINDYFRTYPETAISLVTLYQPCFTRDIETAAVTLGHSIKSYCRQERFRDWEPYPFTFSIAPPLGSPADYTIMHLITKNPDGSTETREFSGRYFYQKGRHYTVTAAAADGSVTGNIIDLGNGIEVIPVLQIPGGGHIAISGKFAQSDNLLIL